DKSSNSKAYVSCDSSPETKTKDSPTNVDVKTVTESDIEDPKNSSTSVNAGRSDSAASRNRPVVNSAGRPNPAGRIRKAAHHSADQPNPAGWVLLLSPQQVILGEIIELIVGDPRLMVDLINLHGFTINDPQGRLKSKMAWVS
nr:hypothetical protein [Tanacetum cinerariifolium]